MARPSSRAFTGGRSFSKGPYAAQGPDLVLDWWSGAGFSASPSLVEEPGQAGAENPGARADGTSRSGAARTVSTAS